MLTNNKKDLSTLKISQILLLQDSKVIPRKIPHLSQSENSSIFAEEKNHSEGASSDV